MSEEFDILRPVTAAQRAWLSDYFARISRQEGKPVTTPNTGADRQVDREHFSDLVREQMTLRGCNRQTAIKIVARSHPRAHRAFLAATNPHAYFGS